MTGGLGGKIPAGMERAHLAGNVETVARQGHPALPVTHHFLPKEV